MRGVSKHDAHVRGGRDRRRMKGQVVGWFAALLASLAIPYCSSISTKPFVHPKEYVGHLDNIPVRVPRPYARFISYDGKPGFLEKYLGRQPKRNFQSGINGFAFEVHYPDLAVRDFLQPEATPKETISDSRWLRVSLVANSHFSVASDVYMARQNERIKLTGIYRDVPLDAPVYDLKAYRPSDEHPEVVKNRYVGMGGENKYLDIGADGKTLTYITCSNREYASSPCTMSFTLDPAIHARIEVTFRKGLLENWKEIRAAASNIVLGFRVADQPQQAQTGAR